MSKETRTRVQVGIELERLRRSISLFRELAGTPDPQTLYEKLLASLVQEFGASHALLARVRPVAEQAEVLAHRSPKGDRPPESLSLSHPLLAAALGDDRPVQAIAQLGEGDRGIAQGVKSLLIARFRLEGDETDLLLFESLNEAAFGEDEVAFLADLVQTLEAVLLNRFSQRRSDKELGLLLEVAGRRDGEIARALDESELSSLLEKILQLALSRTQCRHGAVFLVDEDSQSLSVEAETFSADVPSGVPKELRKRTEQPSGISFWVMENNRPYRAEDTEQDPHYTPVFEHVRSSLAVPMSFQERCIGVILVESQTRHYFAQDHEDLLVALAQTATSFVRRAQLFRKTQEEAGGNAVLIKGRGPAWDEVERRLERAAATSASVCLRGESGTGKELVAHAIHFNSNRSKMPFVAVNCAAIPADLLESELFGHVKGAFTGAVADRAGRFETGNGGTIFLDEIGDLPPQLQVKLLRVLQSGEVVKVGSDQIRRVDVRVIAATSRDLETMMGHGRFREDLYYRLMVVPMYLPPLREYRNSIPGMVKQFLHDANVRYSRSVAGVDPGAMTALLQHSYPGNVRELRNIIEQGVLMADGAYLLLDNLPAYLRGEQPPPPMPGSLVEEARPSVSSSLPLQGKVGSVSAGGSGLQPPNPELVVGETYGFSEPSSVDWDYKDLKERVLARFEDRYLDHLLSLTGGNVTRAAELAGMHRVNLHRMLKRRQARESGPN